MTPTEIATKLAGLCRQGKFEEAQKELFAADAVSIEPHASPGFEKVTSGLDSIIKKGKKFAETTEALHEVSISDPLVAGNSIAFKLTMAITMKGRQRETWEELCLYQVKDGKIISEEFFI